MHSNNDGMNPNWRPDGKTIDLSGQDDLTHELRKQLAIRGALQLEVNNLLRQNKTLREALEWYTRISFHDGGRVAREALGEKND